MIDFDELCGNFENWPNSWKGLEEDVPYGAGILVVFRPFIEHLIAAGLTKRTLRNHVNNLWLLGGETIRKVSLYEEYDVPALKKISECVDEEGGPYCKHLYTESEIRSFDATCKKLHKFLKNRNPEPTKG
ncbi:MAG: hypothetical protein L3J03_02330 [Desulfobacterales bacterium]|nr:hypothetical protein [Desulfobacterales bacterium]